MAAYTVQQYLMDTMAIQATVTKLWRYYDMKMPKDKTVQMVVDEVLAPQVTIDYKILLGKDEYTISAAEHAKDWYGFIETLSGSVHMVGNVFTDLPKPAAGVARPSKVVANGQASVVLRRDDKIARNGGIILIELERMESKGEWEWRICGLKMANKAFEDGDNLFS